MIPHWLHLLSIAAIVLGIIAAVVIAIDEMRRPQHMWIMNVVWPITALYGGPLALWFYFRHGQSDGGDGSRGAAPFAIVTAKAATHCGAGCTLGDIIAEGLAYAFPAIAVALGWHSIFTEKTFAVWVLDFILAFLIGIAFQYFTITPMRDLSPREGVAAALKADTLSLCAWQIGMYGFMAFAQFYFFRTLLGARVEPNDPEFWLAMQVAMLAGFATGFPVNWWLLKAKIKEPM